MDEASFDIDSGRLAEASRLFPAHRLTPAAAEPGLDVSYLARTANTDFARHAWDEAGAL